MALSKKELQEAKKRVENTTENLSSVLDSKAKEEVSKSKEEFIRKTITINRYTLNKIDNFRKEKGLDLSSAIRFIINDYFNK